MGASYPAGTPPVVTLEVARGISSNECPTGGTHRVRRAQPGDRRYPCRVRRASVALVAASGPARKIYPAARAPLTHFQQ